MPEPPLWTAHYGAGVPPRIAAPDESLDMLAERAAREAPRCAATTFFGRTRTYGRLGDQIARAAQGLHALGVRPGDRVAILLPNCPQHLVAFYAVLRLGAVVVEHNPLYTPRELRHMFEDHTARIAICWDVAVPKLREQPSDIAPEHIVAVNLTSELPLAMRAALHLPFLRRRRAAITAKAPDTIGWKKLLRHRPLPASHPHPSPSSLALIQYTSGTTSLPKGAMLTHANLYANTLQAFAWLPGLKPREEVFYSVLPMFHAFGLTLVLTLGVMLQGRLVLFPTPDAREVLSAAKHFPPTVFGGVPPIFYTVAAMAKRKRVSLASARMCFCGGMALPEQTAQLWDEVAGTPLIEGYGMTEASPVICGNPVGDNRRPGTVGVPFPSTDVRVVAIDDPTTEVGTGERGELLVRGPQIFGGYWNNPDETGRALLPGGWLRTGDVVTQDADGFVTIVDRTKELIITGGFNVSPSEVEAVLHGHPDIAEAAVIGVPRPAGGERVCAAVVLREGCALHEDDVRAYCKQRLAAYKVPRIILPVDELPHSLLGKVLRAQVRDLVAPDVTDHR
ncbi:MAG: long-chain-fatty-acid--CoA ligase [Propionibacteriaceae bacterium]|nr:long-chain-fatty-acid--CoA ligase [Propionibacteriaceae bacterium]